MADIDIHHAGMEPVTYKDVTYDFVNEGRMIKVRFNHSPFPIEYHSVSTIIKFTVITE